MFRSFFCVCHFDFFAQDPEQFLVRFDIKQYVRKYSGRLKTRSFRFSDGLSYFFN